MKNKNQELLKELVSNITTKAEFDKVQVLCLPPALVMDGQCWRGLC